MTSLTSGKGLSGMLLVSLFSTCGLLASFSRYSSFVFLHIFLFLWFCLLDFLVSKFVFIYFFIILIDGVLVILFFCDSAVIIRCYVV